MGYFDLKIITAPELLSLRHQRLRTLEANYFAACLLLEEDAEDAQAALDVAELRRRIEHHRSVVARLEKQAAEQEALPVEHEAGKRE